MIRLNLHIYLRFRNNKPFGNIIYQNAVCNMQCFMDQNRAVDK